MPAFITTFIVGGICVILGISNTRGNISSLHSYHRHRVSEEDRLPFGRIVGAGTITIGGSVIVFSVLSAITILYDKQIFILLGTGIMVIGIIVGLVISFFGMIKYNKGIF